MTIEVLGQREPYKGLKPYEEENQGFFFGRESETSILVDKIFSNRLTLLFAASGVGKSSLLQASVIPELKRPDKGNLDVVYFNDWVGEPLAAIKSEALTVLRKRGKIDRNILPDEDLTLSEFFLFCTTFSSEPLVMILDQFEEFFQYQRYKKGYHQIIQELSTSFNNADSPMAFVISMREGFAMKLNAFRDYLPTTLFENYFRLEPLSLENAQIAIEKPAKLVGYTYEPELLKELLKNLADREKESRLGPSAAKLLSDVSEYVEPPYLQIVCTHLWNIEKNSPDKRFHIKTYDDQHKAEGIVDSYFHHVMQRFSQQEKLIASRAFNHLVTPHGTKMAYTVNDLSEVIRVNAEALHHVLSQLEKFRVLRQREREQVIWYELYHDIFAKIIYVWNEAFKDQQKKKKDFILSGIVLACFVLLFCLYNFISNCTSHHFQMDFKSGASAAIELHQGNAKGIDIFNIRQYEAETNHQRNEVEPDKLFEKKQVGDFDEVNKEVIGHLPLTERISEYWKAGMLKEAFELGEKSISADDMDRALEIIEFLASCRSDKGLKILKDCLKNDKQSLRIRKEIIFISQEANLFSTVPTLNTLLTDRLSSIRIAAAQALVRLGSAESVQPLISALKDENSDVREAAAQALGRLGSAESVQPLINTLKDENPYVRRAAAWALGRLESTESVQPLINALKDEDYSVPGAVTQALVRLGSAESVQTLISALKDENSDVREAAARVLGRLGSTESVQPLINTLKDEDSDVRKAAAQALVRLGSAESVQPLINALKDENADVRGAAVQALVRLGSAESVQPLISALKDENSDVREAAAQALGSLGSAESVQPLIKALKEEDSSLRGAAARALGSLGSAESVQPLISALKDENSDVREAAAQALGSLGSAESVQPLISALKDENSDVREAAAQALGSLGSAESVQPLINNFKDEEHNVRITAAQVLGSLGSAESVQPLINALKDEDFDASFAAAHALAILGSAESVQPLINALKDENADVRGAAVRVLGRLGSAESVQPLINALKDEDSDVRGAAAWALGSLGSAESVQPLINALKDENSDVRRAAARALDSLGSAESVQPLINALKDENSDVREAAVQALGSLGSAESIQPLINALKDEDSNVRGAAAWALGSLGSAESIQPLINALKDEDSYVRGAAARALGSLGSTESVRPLINALKDEDSDVRGAAAAAQALGSLGSAVSVQPLINALKDEDSDVSGVAAQALVRLGSAVSVQPLINTLKGEDFDALDIFETPIAAAQALGSLGSAESVQPLINALKEESSSLRQAAAQALGSLGSAESIQPLINALKDEDSYVRGAAARALGKLGSTESVRPLINALKDEDSYVRGAAAQALGSLGSAESVQPLINAIKDQDRHVRYYVLKAFGKMKEFKNFFEIKNFFNKETDVHLKFVAGIILLKTKDAEAIEYIKNTMVSRKLIKSDFCDTNNFCDTGDLIFETLKEIPSNDAKSLLLSMLQDNNPNICVRAIKSLGHFKSEALLPHIVPLIDSRNNKIRGVVIDFLIEMKSPKAIKYLKKIILNEKEKLSKRLKIIAVLCEINTDEAIPFLLSILKKSELSVQHQIVLTLGKKRSPKAIKAFFNLLKNHEAQKAEWRKFRHTWNESFTPEQKDEWQRKYQHQNPKSYMAFALGHAISRINPEDGIKLLSHDLYSVRKGAWTGLGEIASAQLVIDIHNKRQEALRNKKSPWFFHAAYRAIDNSLIKIEHFGTKEDLEKLQTFLPSIENRKNDASYTRVDWTINQLKERMGI